MHRSLASEEVEPIVIRPRELEDAAAGDDNNNEDNVENANDDDRYRHNSDGGCFPMTDGALHCRPDQFSCYEYESIDGDGSSSSSSSRSHAVCVTSSSTTRDARGHLTSSICDGATLDGYACDSCKACEYSPQVHGMWPFAVECEYTFTNYNGQEFTSSYKKTCPSKPIWWFAPLVLLAVVASRCYMLWRLPGPKDKEENENEQQQEMVEQSATATGSTATTPYTQTNEDGVVT